MEIQNKQKAVEKEVKELVQRYNVLLKSQLYAYFEKDGRDKFVGRALKALEKERSICINQETKEVAANETGFSAWERGTMQAFWVLIDIMGKKKVEQHFLAAKEEYPIRIIFVADADIFDISYIAETDIQLANNLFTRRKIEGCGHIVIVEQPKDIAGIQIPDTIGYCTVAKEDGHIEYYRKDD
ncbi:MAG: DUF5697 family protein [Eubacteriales bacterium]|nr:DUF5697 family protein [Eubacteriales bacterium]